MGPLGRGGARRRTRRRMSALNERENQKEQSTKEEYGEPVQSDNSDKLKKLARLLKDKDVITEEEFNLIFD